MREKAITAPAVKSRGFDRDDGFHMASFRKNVTGIDNVVWLYEDQHDAGVCILVAVDPPDTLDHAVGKTASVAVHDGTVIEGAMPAWLLNQVLEFIERNRNTLVDYWNGRIDTLDLRSKALAVADDRAPRRQRSCGTSCR
jgi:hypothetical protein